MGFYSRFFIPLFAVCAAGGAWAECCWCDCPADGCLCPSGIDFDGYDDYGTPICVNPCPNADCSYCDEQPGQYCDSSVWTSACPGLGPEYRCKVIQQNCGYGCKKYQSCNSTNGNVGPDVVSENCHIEGQTCYTNTLACSEFSNRTENGDISCAQTAQQHQATWNGTTWNVGGCSCDIVNAEIETGPFGIPWWCDRFNANFYVKSENNIVSSASDKIVYTMSRMYCSKCHPGYLPKIETSAQINGIYVRPENSGNGNWGVGMCSEQVRVPDYADGCVIKFNLPTGADAYDDCRKECPTGFKTQEQGAESISDCVAQYTPEFEDQTGTFVLTSLNSCQ